MVSIDDAVVSELESQRQTLMLDEAVRLVEQEHPDVGAGVERERFEAYLDATTYGRDAFPSSLEEILVDEESWQGGGHVYRLADDRVSYYPPQWHAELRETPDLREYIRVMGADAMETKGGDREAVTDDGVLKEMLLDAAVAIGGMTRQDVRDQIRELKVEDEIQEYPAQHANPWVQLR
jgi:hypothetical protein